MKKLNFFSRRKNNIPATGSLVSEGVVLWSSDEILSPCFGLRFRV